MKFLLFGTGDYYERYKKWFDKNNVLALLDNSEEKQNRLIDGIKVLSPEEGISLSFDVIVILSFYVRAMKEQLLGLGVSEDKIYHFYDLRRLINVKTCKRQVMYYGNAETVVWSKNDREKKILLVSQDMVLGGASIALFHAAKILAENNYDIVVASMIDGPLRLRLISDNIPVIIDENLQLKTMDEVEWINDFSLILCSTINFHVFLSNRDNSIPVIWWLHDAAFFYDGIDRDVLVKLDRTNMRICSTGPIPENAIRKFIPDVLVKELLYGVMDTAKCDDESKCVCKGKLCFVTIGTIGDIKGQDILVHSIKALDRKYTSDMMVYLVGQNTSLMAQRLKTDIRKMPQIVMTGVMERERINEILERADALICPSREDSMPTVAAEAMMHQVPCIVSDVTGTARYIQNGVDGFVFRSGDAKDLSEKIQWCIENRVKLYDMGIRSREIYDRYFSMEVFEKNLLGNVKDILSEN